jgi:uncharacterized RDD family membrane protein YckC
MADPTAVMGRRVVAYLIDGLIGLALLAAVVMPLFANKIDTTSFGSDTGASGFCDQINDATFSEFDSTETGTSNELPADSSFCLNVGDTAYVIRGDEANTVLGQLSLWSYLTAGLNTIILQGLTGATVGKFLLGLRTVKEDGTRAGIGWNLLRQLVGVVDAFCCGIVGLLVANNSKGHRRVGDMAASTYVVHKSAMGAPIQVPGVAPTVYAPPAGAWGQAPTSGAWGAPTSGAGGWGSSADATQVTPNADGPTWDNARNAYIQYDREVGAWVQWNDDVKAWHPIDQ